MAKNINKKETTTIIVRGDKPVVVLGLDEWHKIEQLIEEKEDALRYEKAIKARDNQKNISFAEVKKELKLK